MTRKFRKSSVLMVSALLITQIDRANLGASSDENPVTDVHHVRSRANEEHEAQVAELYQLQAAFHQAASGAGISADIKARHLSQMLSLFTDDAILVVGTTTYVGKGIPGMTTCDPGSLTLCDFFANHAGSFVLGRNWVSLSPSFKTYFDIHGNTAEVYFECHYFDVVTGLKKADVSFGVPGMPETGQARKVGGVWLLSFGQGASPPLSSW